MAGNSDTELGDVRVEDLNSTSSEGDRIEAGFAFARACDDEE